MFKSFSISNRTIVRYFKKGMKVLVAGANGNVGRLLIQYLNEEGYDPIGKFVMLSSIGAGNDHDTGALDKGVFFVRTVCYTRAS